MTDRKAPGKSHRKGITLLELFEMFPDEATARQWFESIIWKNGVAVCHRCGGTNTYEVANGKPLPHKCRTCRKHFSARHGTILEGSHLSFRQWAIAVYLVATSLKGVSSMKLHRDLGISQPSAWRMLHKIRHALADDTDVYTGTVEVDETYVGGIEKNKHDADKLRAGRGAVGKTAVVGMKERQTKRVKAKVVADTKRSTLHEFINEGAQQGSTVHSDDFISYQELDDFKHHYVKHSSGEYVDGDIHINGIESFWSMLKRAHKGTYHKMSKKHLDRYVSEFAGRHNLREFDTVRQMEFIVAGFIGKRLMNKQLAAGDDGRLH